jgi:hypothetical protein
LLEEFELELLEELELEFDELFELELELELLEEFELELLAKCSSVCAAFASACAAGAAMRASAVVAISIRPAATAAIGAVVRVMAFSLPGLASPGTFPARRQRPPGAAIPACGAAASRHVPVGGAARDRYRGARASRRYQPSAASV